MKTITCWVTSGRKQPWTSKPAFTRQLNPSVVQIGPLGEQAQAPVLINPAQLLAEEAVRYAL
jgi:hypothetical protein